MRISRRRCASYGRISDFGMRGIWTRFPKKIAMLRMTAGCCGGAFATHLDRSATVWDEKIASAGDSREDRPGLHLGEPCFVFDRRALWGARSGYGLVGAGGVPFA